MSNLAHTLFAQGDLVAARHLQEQVLAMARRLLGDQHPDPINAAVGLQVIAHQWGDDETIERLSADSQALLARVIPAAASRPRRPKRDLAARVVLRLATHIDLDNPAI